MLIDDRYFTSGRTEVAGININSGGERTRQALTVQNQINSWIADKEPQYLRAILGNDIFDQLCAIADNDPLIDEIKHILVDETYMRSPIAYYVYFFYERNRISFTTVAGERVKKTAESTAVWPSHKLVSLWNDMVEWNFRIVETFERAGIPVRPDFHADIFQKINIFGI